MKNSKKTSLAVLVLSLLLGARATCAYFQKTEFPVLAWPGSEDRAMVFYISGDAGFSTFSKNIGKDFQQAGYETFALDTKRYFWKKKTPLQTSRDIEAFITKKLANRAGQKVILIGFSFGADVTPFVYNRFSAAMKRHIQSVFIIGPSRSNDFEIHLDEYFGSETKGSLPVLPEINAMKDVPVTVILSDYEFAHFPYWQINLSGHYNLLHLHGDHHYGGNTGMLVQVIRKNL